MMKTKTYYSKELSTALEQIKNELGADAAIVKSRKTRRPGLRGLFSKPVYEIVVSYDPEETARSKKRERPYKLPLVEPVPLGKKKEMTIKPNSEIVQMAAAASKAEQAQTSAPEEKRPTSAVPIEAPRDAKEEVLLNNDFLAEEAEELITESLYTKEDLEIASLLRGDAEKGARSPQPPPAGRLSAYQIVQTMAEDREKKQTSVTESVIEKEKFPTASAANAKKRAAKPLKFAKNEENEPAQELQDDDMEIIPGVLKPEMDARLASMEKMLQALAADMKKMSQSEPVDADEDEEDEEDAASAEETNPGMDALRLRLLDQDVDAGAVEHLVNRALELMKKDESLSPGGAMRNAIRELLGKPKYLQSSTKGTRVIMLMGPTGVGKTTTVAKLAAECVFNRHARVGIINADVFRVGAQEQLETYANILGADFRTIHNAEELRSAIEELSECRYVFVDTAGHASMDKKYQDELAGMINLGVMHEIYLVTSGTTSSRICKQIAHNYSFAKKYKNILTKLDEAGSYGNAVTLSYYGKQPLSYFTIGQNVPEDIRRADMEVVIDMLLRLSR